MGVSSNTRVFSHTGRVTETALPYITNASPVDERPHYVAGSNAVCTLKGTIERRLGFGTYTADSYGANADIVRWFTWKRWSAAFYTMICVIDSVGGTSKVYKLKTGTDATFVLIHTDATSAEPFDFVTANNFLFFGNGTDMKKYDGTTVTNWGIDPQPTTAPTFTSLGVGNIPNYIGHKYVYAYGVSATGYVSDISSLSVDSQTVTVTPLQSFSVTGPRSTDAQCDLVHIYRYEDGGAILLELSNSPIANPGGVWTITDNDADQSLQQSFQAPLRGANSRPTASKGMKFWSGRIWTFKDDKVYFCLDEESTAGVPYESFGNSRTNSYSFGSEIQGLGVTRDYLVVFTISGAHRIGGSSLVSFTRSSLSPNAGVYNRNCIASWGNLCLWLDYSNIIRATDGETISEDDLSLPIRPDLETINHATASLAVFDSGKYQQVILGMGDFGIYMFDGKLKQWNVPWRISSLEAIGVGQTAAGTWKIFAGRGGKPLVQSTTSYLDDGVAYTAYLTVSNSRLTDTKYPNDTEIGILKYVSVESRVVQPSDVQFVIDGDPALSSFTSIVANITDPANRSNGQQMIEKWYHTNAPTAGHRVAIYLEWPAQDAIFYLFSFDPVFEVVR